MAMQARNIEFFKVCNCCGEPFSSGQHYLNSVDILPGGIDFRKGYLWANCICGSTHLVRLDTYPEHIRSYLRFLATTFGEKYSSDGVSGEGEAMEIAAGEESEAPTTS